ncbi:MAG: hypothetical protein ABIQ65_10420 [Thermoanaerobaculia bacterium]
MNDRTQEAAARRSALESAARKARRDVGIDFLPEAHDRTLGIEGVARRNKVDSERPTPPLTRS